MKRIVIIDGGPRVNFNTASMLQKFAEGACSVSSEIDVNMVRLYSLAYKGAGRVWCANSRTRPPTCASLRMR